MATPNHLHYAEVRLALAAGKHVDAEQSYSFELQPRHAYLIRAGRSHEHRNIAP